MTPKPKPATKPKPKRKNYPPSEYDEQVAVIEWCDRLTELHPELSLIFSIPNESSKNTTSGHKLNLAGRKKGVPDLMLPVAKQSYHGLFIEMKRTVNAIVSPHQQLFIHNLRSQGYFAQVCEGADEAIGLIKRYMSIN